MRTQLFGSILFMVAALIVVFLVINRKEEPAVVPVVVKVRKVTPITDAQRDRLTLLAHYSRATMAHAKN